VTQGFWRWGWLESWLRDAKFALRSLRRSRESRGFAAAVVGTLAVGIGAALAMFTVVDRVLLRSLPYSHPDRLVEIWEAARGSELQRSSPYFDVEQWRESGHALSGIGLYIANTACGFRFWREPVPAGNRRPRMRLTSTPVSANLFPVLGVAPSLGTGF
jgi:hypothetical protein